MPDYEPAVILSACRTPIGSFGGALKDLSAADLGAVVIREAICRAGVEAKDLGDVIMGCVLQAGAGMNVARQAALKAGVPQDVPAETVNRVCGSGLQAVVHAVEATRVGYTELVLAGGTESMSNAPYILKGARWGYRMGHGEVLDSMLIEGLTCAIQGCHMGITAEEIVSRFKVSREDQDAFAAESQRRAEAAIRNGLFKDEIVPVEIPQKKGDPLRVETDEYPRAGTTAEKLAALKPAFKKDGSVTAGNASGINDGAAAVIVATQRTGREAGKDAAREDSLLRHDRRRPGDHGHGAGGGDAQGARPRAAEGVGHRPVRAERSVRVAVAGRRARARPRCEQGEHARRRHRARPSDRRQRCPHPDDADLRAAGAGRRQGRRLAVHRRRHGYRDGHRGGGCLTASRP